MFLKRLSVLCMLISALATAAPPQRVAAAQLITTDKQDVLWAQLQAKIEAVEQGLDGVLGVAILDLTTGRSLLVHPDEVFPQASVIKIPLLAELYRQHTLDASTVPKPARLTDRYVMQVTDLVADSDIMGGLTPGVTVLTNRDLATMMVAVSDNSATNVLIDRVGMAQVQKLTADLGLAHTVLRRKMMDLKAAGEGRENLSTPREMMLFLEAVYRGRVIAAPLLEDFFNVLATHKDSWLPAELPSELKVANKPGFLEGVRNDVGIVFLAHRPYIICVMTTYLARERDGELAISRISGDTYRLFDRLARASEYGRVVSPRNAGAH